MFWGLVWTLGNEIEQVWQEPKAVVSQSDVLQTTAALRWLSGS